MRLMRVAGLTHRLGTPKDTEFLSDAFHDFLFVIDLPSQLPFLVGWKCLMKHKDGHPARVTCSILRLYVVFAIVWLIYIILCCCIVWLIYIILLDWVSCPSKSVLSSTASSGTPPYAPRLTTSNHCCGLLWP